MELDRWYFANDRGEPQPIEETELRTRLREGRIASVCLIWRVGWKDWMPADRVRQFSKALGARARGAQEPSIDIKRKLPPPLLPTDGAIERPARLSTPIPTVHGQKPLVRRAPVPTITEGMPSASGGTLRPPGAVPPPPRTVPKILLDGEDWDAGSNERGDSANPLPLLQYGASQRPSTSSMRHAPSVSTPTPASRVSNLANRDAPDEVIVEVPPEELSSPQHSGTELPSTNYDPDSFDTRPSKPNLLANSVASTRSAMRSRFSTSILVTATLTSLGLGFWLTLRRPARTRPTQPTATSVRVEPKPIRCATAGPARRIAPSILMSVAPIAADGLVAGRIAVGFAETPTTAAGITLDPDDLDVSFPFRETKDKRVVSVVPLLIDGQTKFLSQRENQSLGQARAIDASRDFLFGLSDAGFARQLIGGPVETIWAVNAEASVTDPRVSSIPGRAHAVTFRHGGQTGTIMLGWLTEAGRARAGPFQINSPVRLLGTPSLATSATHAMVAFAGRDGDSVPWSLHLSLAEAGQPPNAASAFELPRGGPGGDAISPALAALPDEQWLLQWTEGASGQRQVRIQTLDRKGHPIGQAQSVSPVGSNSGQGLLWSMAKRAVSLFVVSVGRSTELWATPITCHE